MYKTAVSIPDAVLYDTRMNNFQADSFIRRTVAVAYYTRFGISLGYCAQIAGMTEEDFIKFLGQHNISIFSFDNESEFQEEFANA